MRSWKRITAALAVVAVAVFAAACGGSGNRESAANAVNVSETTAPPNSGLPEGSEPVNLDPADFTTKIDNPYWPMSPGSRWIYRETDTTGTRQRVVVEVTNQTKRIANGVEARVIRDTVTENGQPVEVTDDWYAQDSAGNVWYLGEATAEYKNGTVTSTAGSFEAGVHGAQAGIAMPANPEPGLPTARSTRRAWRRTRVPSSPSARSRSRCHSATSTRASS